MDEKTVGNVIRNLRLKKGFTLEQVALKAGVTKSTLSKIETGQISSPISTFMRIGDALSVELAEFFYEPKQKPDFILTRKGKGKRIVRDGSKFGYTYEALALEMPGKKAEPFLLTKKTTDPSGRFQHGGEEFLYILSGKMEVTIGTNTERLYPGDSIYFNPTLPHSSKVLGKQPIRCLCVMIQDEHAQKPARSSRIISKIRRASTASALQS